MAASVRAWMGGGFAESVRGFLGVSLFAMLDEGYENIHPLDQFIILVAQFQMGPLAVIAMVVILLLAPGRQPARE